MLKSVSRQNIRRATSRLRKGIADKGRLQLGCAEVFGSGNAKGGLAIRTRRQSSLRENRNGLWDSVTKNPFPNQRS